MTLPPTLHQQPCGLLTVDETNRIRFINAPLADWLGQDADRLLGAPLDQLLGASARVYYLAQILPSLQQQGHIDEVYLRLKTPGGELPVLLNARRRDLARGRAFDLAIMPIHRRHLFEEQLLQARHTAEQAMRHKEQAYRELEQARAALEQQQQQLTELNRQLEQLATTDPLTGLYNRRVYERELGLQLSLFQRQHQPFSLVLADIDHFKQINDHHGHDMGDRVLHTVAGELKGQLRDLDWLARVGGEEFAVILPGSDQAAALAVAERLRRHIAALDWPWGQVTISLGLAEVSPNDTQSSLFSRADQALYRAKAQGRNQVQTAPDETAPG